MTRRYDVTKIILIAFCLLLASFFIFRGRDYTACTVKLDKLILKINRKNGIDETESLYEKRKRFREGRNSFLKIERRYKVKSSFDENKYLKEVRNALRWTRFKIEKSEFEKDGRSETSVISFLLNDKILYEIKFFKTTYIRPVSIKHKGGKIAIILDDFGYNMNNLDELFKIGTRTTISVLPNLPYSKTIAEQASRNNIEIMLHLPMEPHDKDIRLEEGTIMVSMKPQEIAALLNNAIENVPGLKGVSNHMGSKATEDENVVRELFNELKKRNLYFLDNLVTDKSVCSEAAGRLGLRQAARNVFLDNELEEDYIENQIMYTADIASKAGYAIGVGHDRPVTIKVLAKVIPRLKAAGFDFVYVSEVVK